MRYRPDDHLGPASSGPRAFAARSGEQVVLVGGPVVEFVRLVHPEVHLLRAVDLFGPAVQGLQVAWADDRGRWPWDIGFRGSRGGQPVLGQREPVR